MQLKLIKTLELIDYPSSSAMEYNENMLYIIGDDARFILILNNNYEILQEITLFKHEESRIPKKEKVDLEASCLIESASRCFLLLLGSGATALRKRAVLCPLDHKTPPEFINLHDFFDRIDLKELNIEGLTGIGVKMILANRGNNGFRFNTLLITSNDFLFQQNTAPIGYIDFVIQSEENFIGISDLCYLREKDILFFTASSEETMNAYDDGKIGDSYLGWINDISQKLDDKQMMADQLIKLTDFDKAFDGEKIEGICLEKYNENIYTFHLCSDNDDGMSKLFKIEITI